MVTILVANREERLHSCVAHFSSEDKHQHTVTSPILTGISRIQQEGSRGYHDHCAVFILCILGLHAKKALVLTSVRARMQERNKLLRLCSNLGVYPDSRREIQLKESAGSAPNSVSGTDAGILLELVLCAAFQRASTVHF